MAGARASKSQGDGIACVARRRSDVEPRDGPLGGRTRVELKQRQAWRSTRFGWQSGSGRVLTGRGRVVRVVLGTQDLGAESERAASAVHGHGQAEAAQVGRDSARVQAAELSTRC
jgi:hypothetical protein